MSQILTTPPAVEPLSLAETKSHLRLTHADDDAYVSTLMISARRLVEAQYGICLLQQSWSIFRDQWPSDGIFTTPLFPVISVVDLKVYGDDDVAATIDPAHYYLDATSRPARIALRRGRAFPSPGRRTNGIELKLTTGFGTTAAAVPQFIKQALLIIIADWFGNRGDGAGATIPISALELLAPYKNLRLI
jgi:uncharacterized phiE125 gp8 family phage protein